VIPSVSETPSGILLVDKPEGMTSARAVARVKRALKATKVGHAGTLDPFATGLLICCIDRATRLVRFWMSGDKTYQATLLFGIETDTGDLTGKPVFQSDGLAISEERIRAAFGRFTGEMLQAPPVYAALKHEGVPLYRWARKGKQIQKPPRTVFIRRLTLLEIDYPKVRFEVTCSAGTYIRSLAADVGRTLQCGGHLVQLRRIESGGFRVQAALPLQDLESAVEQDTLKSRVIPMAEALRDLPARVAGNVAAAKLRCGRLVGEEELHPAISDGRGQAPAPCIKVIDENGALLAVLSRNANGSYGYLGVFQ